MWAALFAREARGVARCSLRPGLFPGSAGQPGAHRRHRQAARTGIYRHAAGLRHAVADHEVADSALVRFQALHPGIDVQLTTQGRSSWTGAATPAAMLLRHGYMAHAELSCVHAWTISMCRWLAALHRTQPAGRAGRLPGPSAVESRGGRYWPRWFALAKVDVPAHCPAGVRPSLPLHAGRHERSGHRAGAVVPAAGRHRR